MKSYERERAVAVDAVVKACQLCWDVQQSFAVDEKIAKSDRSPVTVADFGAQAMIVSDLLRTFPHDPIVGEEEADVLRQADQTALKANVLKRVQAIMPELSEHAMLAAIDYGAQPCDFSQRYWTLDPIDGTKGFLRGEQYAVALALIEDGQPMVGVLGCPNLPLNEANPARGKGCVFIAVKGQGAWVRPLDLEVETRIAVDGVSEASNARFCESVEAAHASLDDHAKIAALLKVTAPPYRIDSQCKYAAVARGDASIYLRITTNYLSWIWDHAAGVIITQEAGGKVTDMHGQPLDFSQGRKLVRNPGIIATNGQIHAAVIAAVKQVVV